MLLENRPIVQKSLLGAGAFMFVFSAAMGGTAFMLTGGFGSGEHNPFNGPVTLAAASSGEWADVSDQTPQIVYVRQPAPVTVTPVSMPVETPPDVAPAASDESMLGDSDNAPAAAPADFPTLDKPDKVAG